jgi:hypothetical protein
VDTTRDSSNERANEECSSVAAVCSDRCPASQAGDVASGDAADEIAAERAEMAPYSSASLSNPDFSDVALRESLDELPDLGDSTTAFEHAVRPRAHVVIHELSGS